MDRVFLEYYEDELTHLRRLAEEFARMHPAVAGNLALDVTPCPDPYVERLLEGVAYLTARTRHKIDAERSRYARTVLEALYPDLAAPAPAMTMVVLHPGPQVATMAAGHVVPRGTHLLAALREGLTTRATYATAQDVRLWPVALRQAEYLETRDAVMKAGVPRGRLGGAEAAIRLTFCGAGPVSLGDLSLDGLDLQFADRTSGGRLFDAIFGHGAGVFARAGRPGATLHAAAPARMIGIADEEALIPRSRPGFEGYRLLREYFLMPERFHAARLSGLAAAVAECEGDTALEVMILLGREQPQIASLGARDVRLFATPAVNLFERECNIVDLERGRRQHIVHADRTRPRDFEIYRMIRVSNADRDGPDADVPALFSIRADAGGPVHSLERRPRRPVEEELRDRQFRTSYPGDEVYVSLSHPPGQAPARPVRRLDIRALVTNRDLPIIDDGPRLSVDSGDPVERVELLDRVRPPRSSLPAVLPRELAPETRLDDLAWRLVGQLQLNFLSLADPTPAAEPLRAILQLYADRGDPGLARHVRAVTGVHARAVVDRLRLAGPICYGQGMDVTLDIDDAILSGHSRLLLSALLDRVFARAAAINGFVRTRTRIARSQEEIAWPMTPGLRPLI